MPRAAEMAPWGVAAEGALGQQGFVESKGTSEGAATFMNNPD